VCFDAFFFLWKECVLEFLRLAFWCFLTVIFCEHVVKCEIQLGKMGPKIAPPYTNTFKVMRMEENN